LPWGFSLALFEHAFLEHSTADQIVEKNLLFISQIFLGGVNIAGIVRARCSPGDEKEEWVGCPFPGLEIGLHGGKNEKRVWNVNVDSAHLPAAGRHRFGGTGGTGGTGG
jgi:hypothetical protein